MYVKRQIYDSLDCASAHAHIPFQSVERIFFTQAFTKNPGVRSSQRMGWHRDLLRGYIYRVAHFCSFCGDTTDTTRMPPFLCVTLTPFKHHTTATTTTMTICCVRLCAYYFECESRSEADELQRSRVVEMELDGGTQKKRTVCFDFGILAITDTFQPHQSRRPHHLDGNDT